MWDLLWMKVRMYHKYRISVHLTLPSILNPPDRELGTFQEKIHNHGPVNAKDCKITNHIQRNFSTSKKYPHNYIWKFEAP